LNLAFTDKIPKELKAIGIIPARYASTRLPGKPLVDIGGKSMIQRVYEQVMKAGLESVIVATDDARILEHVIAFGGEAVMTSESHTNGTERCAEVVEKCVNKYAVAINIQGDEPFIHPEQIAQLKQLMGKEDCEIGTLIKKIETLEELNNPDAIKKVEVNEKGEAMCFSRSVIPYIQGVQQSEWLAHHTFYKHIGIYGFRTETLAELVKLKPTKNEMAESLEQLRWLDNGYTIHTVETVLESPSVDTEEDLVLVRDLAKGA